MKTSKVAIMMATMLALCSAPAFAQRGGGGRGGSTGGSRSTSSMSSSRSTSSMSSGRSSSSMSSGRSTSSVSSGRSSSSVSTGRSSSSVSHRSSGTPSRAEVGTRGRTERGGARVTTGRSTSTTSVAPRGSVRSDHRSTAEAARGNVPSTRGAAPASAGTRGIRGSGHDAGYAHPGRPGGYMPPADRPIHPAPYFHHPWHHHMVHCHLIYWDPIPPRPWYWPGFWGYCNSYWYDYHVTDVVVVHDYVQKTYNVDLVTYAISDEVMYAIVKDGGSTYLQVYDKEDHLMAEQKINKKYCNMVIDAENGGCWISKKNGKDPLLFIWADGKLLIYEED